MEEDSTGINEDEYNQDLMARYTDPMDRSIAWEFELWKRAEIANFQAELKKERLARLAAIQEEFAIKKKQIEKVHKERLSKSSEVEISILNTVSSGEAKLSELRQKKKTSTANLAEIKLRLAKLVSELEADGQQNILGFQNLLATHVAEADQMTSQATFFNNELKNTEKKRVAENENFINLLQKLNESGNIKLKNELIVRERQLLTLKENIRVICLEMEELKSRIDSKIKTADELEMKIKLINIESG